MSNYHMSHSIHSNHIIAVVSEHQSYFIKKPTSLKSSLLVASQGDVSRKLNQAFLLVDLFIFNFVDEECSDILRS